MPERIAQTHCRWTDSRSFAKRSPLNPIKAIHKSLVTESLRYPYTNLHLLTNYIHRPPNTHSLTHEEEQKPPPTPREFRDPNYPNSSTTLNGHFQRFLSLPHLPKNTPAQPSLTSRSDHATVTSRDPQEDPDPEPQQ